MKISEIDCLNCGSSYSVAESTTVAGSAGRFQCVNCGLPLASWSEPRLRAYRLELSLEHKYANIPAPPSPLITAA